MTIMVNLIYSTARLHILFIVMSEVWLCDSSDWLGTMSDQCVASLTGVVLLVDPPLMVLLPAPTGLTVMTHLL